MQPVASCVLSFVLILFSFFYCACFVLHFKSSLPFEYTAHVSSILFIFVVLLVWFILFICVVHFFFYESLAPL